MHNMDVFTQAAPDFTITLIEFQYSVQVFHGPWEVFFCPKDTRYCVECLD